MKKKLVSFSLSLVPVFLLSFSLSLFSPRARVFTLRAIFFHIHTIDRLSSLLRPSSSLRNVELGLNTKSRERIFSCNCCIFFSFFKNSHLPLFRSKKNHHPRRLLLLEVLLYQLRACNHEKSLITRQKHSRNYATHQGRGASLDDDHFPYLEHR